MSIPGLGLKESSHFMRNIGNGANLALLDRHVMDVLLDVGIIPHSQRSLTWATYESIEGKMARWCDSLGIPMAEMDILLFSEATGEIAK